MKYEYNPLLKQLLQKTPSLTSDLTDDIGYVKTTPGQTINVSTAAELTAALAGLAAAPSLLGDVVIQLTAGTYASDVTIPSLAGNGFSLTLQGGTTTNLSTSTTGGTAGTAIVQSTVVRNLAGWGVNAYRGMWLKFTSGALSGRIRVIESNTADTITLVGSYFNSNPANGDTFVVYSNLASITGNISVPPSTCELRLQNLNIRGLGGAQFKMIMTECQQTVYGYLENTYELVAYQGYRNYYIGVLGVTGLWFSGCSSRIFQSYFRGGGDTGYGYHWSVLGQSGGQIILYAGCCVDYYSWGVWANIGGAVNLNSGTGGDTQADNTTNPIIKNNTVGIYADSGGHVASDVVYSGNGTDAVADALSYSWIGL